MKIVCLGDSLTYGYGVPRRDCWVSLAAEMTGHTIVNKGVNGDTAGGMLARFRRDVAEEAPRLLFVMGGGNDILFSGTDAQARADMAALVHQALALGLKVLLGLPAPAYPSLLPAPWRELADFQALEPVRAAYRDWLIRSARTFRIGTVDFSLPAFAPPRGEALYLDGLHLGREGHRLMAAAFAAALPPVPV